MRPNGSTSLPTTITYHRGDVRDVMARMADGSVHLVVTSPPFLALRSYLPDGHPDKHREIGSEPTPAAFLDTMLGLTADWRRIVTDDGSIAVEIGDTYAGSGSPGGDYSEGGMRSGQPRTTYSGSRSRPVSMSAHAPAEAAPPTRLRTKRRLSGWPLDKSMCLIPTLYAAALAYGVNPLTGGPSPAGDWRVRNLLTWTRPNPPVGALGDKFRPATSFVTVACTGGKRWFDLDAVRYEAQEQGPKNTNGVKGGRVHAGEEGQVQQFAMRVDSNPAGAPPLDWWDANDLAADQLAEHWAIEQQLADWQPLHRLPTQPYSGSHYAVYPEALPRRLIEAMCPRETCTICGEPRRRIAVTTNAVGHAVGQKSWKAGATGRVRDVADRNNAAPEHAERQTLGWTDCGHDAHAPGIVLDPFGGSGTTGVAAARAGRDAVLIDLDARNVDLARQRIATALRIVDERQDGDTTTWTVEAPLPQQRAQVKGQRSIFDELDTARAGASAEDQP